MVVIGGVGIVSISTEIGSHIVSGTTTTDFKSYTDISDSFITSYSNNIELTSIPCRVDDFGGSTEDVEKLLQAEKTKRAVHRWHKLELKKQGCEKSFLKNNSLFVKLRESNRTKRTWNYRGKATFY